MTKKKIEFQIKYNQTYLDKADTLNSNIDVHVTLETGFELTVIVGTPRNLQYVMEEELEVNFYGPGLPWIFVQNLTKEIIHEAIEGYINHSPEAYWIKLHHFAGEIDPAVFSQLRAQEIELQKKCELKIKQHLEELE